MACKPFLTDLTDLLAQGSALILATIIEHDGSTPRTAGARMIVLADGAILGTIGGGLLEARVIAEARGLFGGGSARICRFDLRGDPSSTEMICGGRVTVLLEELRPEPAGFALWQQARRQLEEGRRVVLVGEWTGTPARLERRLLPAGCPLPDDGWPDDVARAIAAAAGGDRAVRIVDAGPRRFLIEPLAGGGTLLLFGGGHVSRQVVALASQVDFDCTVIDDRSEFANRQGFPSADRIVVCPSFDDALSGLAVDADSFLVILTRGHRHDETVLAQALATPAGYIGMIGSRRKRDAIYDSLRRRGFGEGDLDRVHCPIGLPIGAETPAELAVSIVAELIAVRAGSAAAAPLRRTNGPGGRHACAGGAADGDLPPRGDAGKEAAGRPAALCGAD